MAHWRLWSWCCVPSSLSWSRVSLHLSKEQLQLLVIMSERFRNRPSKPGAAERAGRHDKYVGTRGAAWDCARWQETLILCPAWRGAASCVCYEQRPQYSLAEGLWRWRGIGLVCVNRKIPSNVGCFGYLFMFLLEFSGFLKWPEILVQNYHSQLFKK